MPPVKGEKIPSAPLNTSAQIQQIFAEVQAQLPTVDFDTDDSNEAQEENDFLESNLPENTDALLESLSNPENNSFLTLHPKIETPQQPPSVELQMRLSPNLFESSSTTNPDLCLPTASSVLSMDLFNTIDFDRLPLNPSVLPTLTTTFHRPRPMPFHPDHSSTRPTSTNKNRDDRQILERLAQQASRFHQSDRLMTRTTPTTTMQSKNKSSSSSPLENLQSALFPVAHEIDRHGRRSRIPEAQRKTVFIDLRHSEVAQSNHSSTSNQNEMPSRVNPIVEQQDATDSSSDEDQVNDGMLWFEKRQLAKRQQQQQPQN